MSKKNLMTNKLEYSILKKRDNIKFVEEGNLLAPKFDSNGLIPAIITDFESNHLLMHCFMNEEALIKTLQSGEAYYWSRSRNNIWKKGESSGMTHVIKEILIDDDQDAIWLRVKVKGLGGSCHVGYKSCFYRSVNKVNYDSVELEFKEKEKILDPKKVYPGSDSPTQL